MANLLQVVLRLSGQNAGASTAIMQVHDALELADMAVQAFTDSAGKLVAAGIGMNSLIETTTLQFRALGLSAAGAQQHVADLVEVAKQTPFETGPLLEASRSLRVLGGAALDTHDNLLLVGDAAAATNANIQDVAFWTGRAYSAIQAGRPFGEAAQRLQELGILSADARNHMEDLQKQGASASEVWQALDKDFRRFNGAMADQAETWKGLTSTMSDTIKILSASATHDAFLRLEDDLKRVNAQLADPRAQQNAQTIGQGLAIGVDVAAATVEEGAGRMIAPIDDVNRVIADTTGLVQHSGAIMQAVYAGDAPAALDILKQSFVETQDAAAGLGVHVQSVGTTIASVMNQQVAAVIKLRDEMERIGAQQPIIDQQRQTAHEAEMQRLYEEGQALAHAGDITDIVNAEEVAARNFAAQQAEQAAKEQAAVEKQAAQEAAQARQQAATEAARVEREQHQAAQEAIRRAYVGTADEAEAQFRRIAAASQGVADGMTDLQQQLDEATNRQVRAGTFGSDAARQELDQIRRSYLTLLPDLVALDGEWTAAKQDSRQADLALAAAQRDLAVALAQSGGQQTLQTAALSHAVTTAQAAAAAAHDHAQALSAQRGEAVALTGALQGLGKQQAALGMGGGGLLPPMHVSTPDRRFPYVIPTVVNNTITVDNRGATVGVDNLQRTITDTVNRGIRTGTVQVSGLLAR